MEISLEELREACVQVLEFDFRGWPRTLTTRFRLPEPGVLVTVDDFERALERKRLGVTDDRELVFWSTMLLMNETYEIDPKDEDFIADWLNDKSFDPKFLSPPTPLRNSAHRFSFGIA
jgi:hypothetical protein